MTTVVIVGANGKVGTELSLLFDISEETEVRPVVRNKLGTHFLSFHGLECKIADATNPDEIRPVVNDADVVIIAAFAWQFSREGFQSKGARTTNKKLATVPVKEAPTDATAVYLSSQAAFGDELGAPIYSDYSLYTREKLAAENAFNEASQNTGKDGYILRLGFVHGENQPPSTEFEEDLSQHEELYCRVDPEKPSNVVHTVTLKDAILKCRNTNVEPSIYGLVNEPQWTWSEVIEYYAPEKTKIEYRVPGGNSNLFASKYIKKIWSIIESRQRTLRTITPFLPDRLNQRLFYEYIKSNRSKDISDYRHRFTIDKGAFEFNPMPGERVPGLTPTRELFSQYQHISECFDHG